MGLVTPSGPVRVRVGDPIVLECQSSGEPRPSVSWHKLDSSRKTMLNSPAPMDSNVVLEVQGIRPVPLGRRDVEGVTVMEQISNKTNKTHKYNEKSQHIFFMLLSSMTRCIK